MTTKPTIAVLGIDPGKDSCSVTGLDSTGRVILRRRLQLETGKNPLALPLGVRTWLQSDDRAPRG